MSRVESRSEGWPGVSEPLPNAKLRVLSLGAGVQSSVLALMAARGEIGPMPDCAIFADTQWEPRAVYEWLDWLEHQLPFPVYRVTRGSLRASVLRAANGGGERFAAVPFFVEGHGLGMRQCTREHKVEPIERKIRELLGLQPRQRGPKTPVVEQWIGISSDEKQRMKHNRTRFIKHRWPLIEKRMSRRDCLRWMEERQYPMPTKSACIACPYHDNALWRDMRDNDPESWSEAVAIDTAIRANGPLKGMRRLQYVHRSLKPLSEAPIDEPDTGGQGDLFQNECEGMCGV
jgi:hypothetical protein